MAVDSLAKRHSALQAYSAAGWRVPLPNREVDAADRATLCWMYGGMFVAAAETETVIGLMRIAFVAKKPTMSFVEITYP